MPPVVDILGPVTNILAAITHMFPAVSHVLPAISHIFNAVAEDALRPLRPSRSFLGLKQPRNRYKPCDHKPHHESLHRVLPPFFNDDTRYGARQGDVTCLSELNPALICPVRCE